MDVDGEHWKITMCLVSMVSYSFLLEQNYICTIVLVLLLYSKSRGLVVTGLELSVCVCVYFILSYFLAPTSCTTHNWVSSWKAHTDTEPP
jgi:hypothetical protein